MKRLAWMLVSLLLALCAYLGLWPVPIEPVAWTAPPSPGYTGTHTPNHLLAGLQRIALGGEIGPEHVVLAKDGQLYAAVASGRILRMQPDGSQQQIFAATGGRVLGFDFDADGNLIAADALKGLLSIAPDGKVSVLADKVGGDPIRYADAVVVATNGRIYFSDASTRFSPAVHGTFEAAVLDAFEHSCTGRVLEHDPAVKSTRIVASGLCFANGVALSKDQESLFVAETGMYRVWRIALAASGLDVRQASAQASVLLDNLPGYPDNLMRGRDGRIWLGLVKPRSATADAMADKPWLRKLTLRLPRAWWPVPEAYGHVVAFNERGMVSANLQDPTGAYPETSGLTETAERLYVQSLHADWLGFKPMGAIAPPAR